jgi:hypothetical protein
LSEEEKERWRREHLPALLNKEALGGGGGDERGPAEAVGPEGGADFADVGAEAVAVPGQDEDPEVSGAGEGAEAKTEETNANESAKVEAGDGSLSIPFADGDAEEEARGEASSKSDEAQSPLPAHPQKAGAPASERRISIPEAEDSPLKRPTAAALEAAASVRRR